MKNIFTNIFYMAGLFPNKLLETLSTLRYWVFNANNTAFKGSCLLTDTKFAHFFYYTAARTTYTVYMALFALVQLDKIIQLNNSYSYLNWTSSEVTKSPTTIVKT